ncbi:hypothetical protein ACFY9N_16880 [Microbacterium sp. NPDC008134]|uniref:hypothetical protein n=1 Tax=Microbacterium sp. NPDC008134 TaxID=3364183 RepID=UPI0036E6A0E4
MTHARLPLRSALALSSVLAVLLAAGCAAAESPADDAPTATSTSVPADADAGTATDEESCAGFSDVMTILHNVGAAVHDGRMTDQEKSGWYALATRVLDRVPATGEGPISDALTATQEAAPAVAIGAGGSTGIESDAWNAAGGELREACEAEGYQVVAEGFVGG